MTTKPEDEANKQLQIEIDDLKAKRLQYERDSVEEVRKLQAEYKTKSKATITDAATDIRPVAEAHRVKLDNLGRDYKTTQAKIQRDVEAQIVALRRSLHSQLDRAKHEHGQRRDELAAEHKQFADAVEKKMHQRQEDLGIEEQLAVEVMQQEYAARIAEVDEQLSVLNEAIQLDKDEDKERRQKARDEAERRRKSRQEAEAAARSKKLADSIKAQGGPLKKPEPRKPKSKYASKKHQARP